MITLPRTAMLSRGRLRAFWLGVWLPVALLSEVMVWAAGRGRARIAVTSAVVAAVAPVLVRPSLARWPYRAWNRGAHRVGDLATRYAAWVTYGSAIKPLESEVFDATSERVRNNSSRWGSRGTRPAAAYRSGSPAPEHGALDEQPLAVAYRWARDSGRPRARWLIACLGVLRWLQPPADSATQPNRPSDTYTLY